VRLAEYLLTNYATDSGLQACMNNLQIWIIPVLNPDGYVAQGQMQRFSKLAKELARRLDGCGGVHLSNPFMFRKRNA
jgi:hypothetical protein